jgi:hypothetical protein
MKHVLLFSCEPGGAEVLIPVITLLKKNSYKISVLAYGQAAERFKRRMISYNEIGQVGKDDASIFDDLNPDFIITSATSHPSKDMSEKYIWQTARKVGIKTLAFLDQWQNYAIRFSGISENERLRYLPDYINCINDIGRQEMLHEGFPRNKLVCFGHPYLSSIRDYAKRIERENVKRKLGLRNDPTVHLFVSEPIREYYKGSRGYDQYEVLSLFLDSLTRRVNEKHCSLIVKLHPKDDAKKFRTIQDKFEQTDMQFIQNELTSLECISIADYVYGMTSVMLIEAYLLDKRVLSLQPNLKIDDPLVLSRYDYINKISSYGDNDFHGAFRKRNATNEFTFQFSNNRFLDFLHDELCDMERISTR